MKRRYSSWGTDGSYRWKWRAKVQDIIYASKKGYQKIKLGKYFDFALAACGILTIVYCIASNGYKTDDIDVCKQIEVTK